MKLRSHVEGLAIPVIVAAVLAKDTIVALTADNTVNKAGADAKIIGRLSVPAREANGKGTVETKFKELVEIKGSGVLAAGATVKLAAPDGTTGENVVAAWVAGTDSAAILYGIVLKGGASGATLEVLVY
jgi:hypothetical protein